MKPRIFVSAVSKELRSARQIIANTLIALGYEPIWQDIFGISSSDIRPMLREKIDSCSAVIQIIGDAYGAEPPTPDEAFGRVSYTQYEALYAQAKRKHVYYLLAQDTSPRDADPLSIDLPIEDSDAGRADADLRRELQRKYRDSIQVTEHIYYAVQSHTETELTIRRLKDELNRLRRGFRSWMVTVSVGLAFIAAAVTWILLGLPGLSESIKKVETNTAEKLAASELKTKEMLEDAIGDLSDPEAFAERIRREVHAAAEEKIKALSQQKGQGQRIAKIEANRDSAIEHVNDLVRMIRDNLKTGASPVFVRGAEILQREGVTEALAYLEARRETTLQSVRKHAEHVQRAQELVSKEKTLRNKALDSLFLEVDLLESRFQLESALKLLNQIAELAPDYDYAIHRVGVVLYKLGRYPEAEHHLRNALRLTTSIKGETECLNSLSVLLVATGRPNPAEILARRSLALAVKEYGQDHQIVGMRFTNLVGLLWHTNRSVEAESLARRALAIDERTFGGENTRVSLTLNNLAMLLQNTNNKSLADSLFRRALAIDEKKHGPMHPYVARDLSNLGTLYQQPNRFSEAEPLLRRALLINETTYGPDHPQVAISLNNLGWVYKAMDRPKFAEQLLRRSILVREKAFGADTIDLSAPLEGLALLFKADRPDDAAFIIERQLIIIHRFEAQSGRNFAGLKGVQDNYREVLTLLQRTPDEVSKLLKSTENYKGAIEAITPKLDERLGTPRDVADVLAEIDRSGSPNHSQGATPLNDKTPMFAQLKKPLLQDADYLASAAERLFNSGTYDEAAVLCEEVLRLRESDSSNPAKNFMVRLYLAAALLELEDNTLAKEGFTQLLHDLPQDAGATNKIRGLIHYYLAVGHLKINDGDSAKAEAEKSLQAFGDDTSSAELRARTGKLLKDLDDGNLPRPLTIEKPKEKLLVARKRFRARIDLFSLPLTSQVTPLINAILGDPKSPQEVLSALDEQYRKEGKPEFWFIPIDKPLGPHLDKILGPLPTPEPAKAG